MSIVKSCQVVWGRVPSLNPEVERKRKVGSYSKTLIPKTGLAGAWSLGLLSAACIAVFNIMPPSLKG